MSATRKKGGSMLETARCWQSLLGARRRFNRQRERAPMAKVLFRVAMASLVLALVSPARAQEEIKVGITNTPPLGGPGDSYYRDVMQAVAERTDLTFEYVEMQSLQDCIPGLLAEDLQILACPLAITDERRAMGIAYTDPFVSWGEVLVVPASDPRPYQSLSEFQGQPLGTWEGAQLYLNLANGVNASEVRTYNSDQDAERALASGEIKGFVTGQADFPWLQEQGLYSQARMVDTYVTALPLDFGLGVRASDPELLAWLNTAVNALKLDGTIASIAAKYQLPPP